MDDLDFTLRSLPPEIKHQVCRHIERRVDTKPSLLCRSGAPGPNIRKCFGAPDQECRIREDLTKAEVASIVYAAKDRGSRNSALATAAWAAIASGRRSFDCPNCGAPATCRLMGNRVGNFINRTIDASCSVYGCSSC